METSILTAPKATAMPRTKGYRTGPALPSAWPLVPAALASSGMLWLCFFPVGWGWLSWIAVVPLLCMVRSQARARGIYFSAWLSGLAFFFPALLWMPVADPRMYYTWAMLAVYCSSYPVI